MGSVETIGRLLLALCVVLLVMWVIARAVRKPRKARRRQLLDVVSRQQITRNSSVAVVRVLDRALVVGVTDAQLSLLGELDLADLEEYFDAEEAATRPSRAARIALPRLRTVPISDADASSTKPATVPLSVPMTVPSTLGPAARPAGRLAGSVLSRATWRQSIDALRDITARS